MDALEKWMIIRLSYQSNHDPTKMDVLPKSFVQIILDAKWLVRYSSKSLYQQQRRPLPSLLSLSLSTVIQRNIGESYIFCKSLILFCVHNVHG